MLDVRLDPRHRRRSRSSGGERGDGDHCLVRQPDDARTGVQRGCRGRSGTVDGASPLAAINLVDRYVLVGDRKQLLAVTQTEAPPSLCERLIETYPTASVMLDKQYRMAQRIQAFPSRNFTMWDSGPRIERLPSSVLTILMVWRSMNVQDQVAFVDVDGEMTGNAAETPPSRRTRCCVALSSGYCSSDESGDSYRDAPASVGITQLGRSHLEQFVLSSVPSTWSITGIGASCSHLSTGHHHIHSPSTTVPSTRSTAEMVPQSGQHKYGSPAPAADRPDGRSGPSWYRSHVSVSNCWPQYAQSLMAGLLGWQRFLHFGH
jgi:hypothetical protein